MNANYLAYLYKAIKDVICIRKKAQLLPKKFSRSFTKRLSNRDPGDTRRSLSERRIRVRVIYKNKLFVIRNMRSYKFTNTSRKVVFIILLISLAYGTMRIIFPRSRALKLMDSVTKNKSFEVHRPAELGNMHGITITEERMKFFVHNVVRNFGVAG